MPMMVTMILKGTGPSQAARGSSSVGQLPGELEGAVIIVGRREEREEREEERFSLQRLHLLW